MPSACSFLRRLVSNSAKTPSLADDRAGVDWLLGNLGRPTALQLMDDVLQVLHQAREPVDAGDDQRVAGTQEVEQDLKLSPQLAFGAGLLF